MRGLKGCDAGLTAFAALVGIIHLAIYFIVAGSPLDGSTTPPWQGFWDQSQYLKSARAFAGGRLSADEHWYALGYPLMAAPFVHLLPKDPFFAINTVSIAVFAVAFVAYFRPVIGSLASMSAFAIALLWPLSVDAPPRINFPIWLQYVMPWNTTPVAALLMVILLLVRRLRTDDSVRSDCALALLAATVVAIRPGDVAPLLVAGAFYGYVRLVRDRTIAKPVAALAAAAVVVGVYMALSWRIYGGLITPYHEAVRGIGASFSGLHERAYAILIDAAATHDEPHTALAALQPWLILAMPFAVAWAALDRARGLLPVAAVAASVVSYISYNDFWPYAVLRFSLIHYLAWTLPTFTAAGIAGLVVVIRDSRWLVLCAAMVSATLLISLRLVPTPVQASRVIIESLPNAHTRYELMFDSPQDVDAVDFGGAMTADAFGVTLKSFDVAQEHRPLALFSGYRPLQLHNRLRISFATQVESRHIEVTLDNTISNHPNSENVRAVKFRWVLASPEFFRQR
jgi:hypothetical protein